MIEIYPIIVLSSILALIFVGSFLARKMFLMLNTAFTDDEPVSSIKDIFLQMNGMIIDVKKESNKTEEDYDPEKNTPTYYAIIEVDHGVYKDAMNEYYGNETSICPISMNTSFLEQKANVIRAQINENEYKNLSDLPTEVVFQVWPFSEEHVNAKIINILQK